MNAEGTKLNMKDLEQRGKGVSIEKQNLCKGSNEHMGESQRAV